MFSVLLSWQTHAYHGHANGPQGYVYNPPVPVVYDYASTIPAHGFPQAPHFFHTVAKGAQEIVYL